MPRTVSLMLLPGLWIALAPALVSAQALPGTKPWEDRGDPPNDMVAGISRFLDRELAASVERRQGNWKRDTSSDEAYVRSIAPNRERFQKLLGLSGERIAPVTMEYVSSVDSPAKVAQTDRFIVYAVRWPVHSGVEGEGLLLEPT